MRYFNAFLAYNLERRADSVEYVIADSVEYVIPANAGIHLHSWIPVFTGMTCFAGATKKVIFFFVLFSSLSIICSSLTYAQEPAPAESPAIGIESASGSDSGGLNQHMALDLRDMDIVDTLKFLAIKGGINIIASKDVTGRVSLFLRDVTIKDALDIILIANNLAYEKRGSILYVMTEAEYKALHGENFKDTRKVRTYNLKYAKPESAFKTIDMLKSEIGKVLIDEESGMVVMMDTLEKLEGMRQALIQLDRPNETRTFSLQYAKAKDVQTALAMRLDAKKTGSVTLDEKNNQVVVTALPDRMKEAEGLVKSFDKKTKQVLLEAKILKVILSDDFDMGIDWDVVWKKVSSEGFSLAGDFAFPSATSNFLKMTVSNSTSKREPYSAIAKALQEFGETRNLSSPSIAVVNGEEAKIVIGRSEAYVTTTLATGSTTSSTAAQVTFLDVGVQLIVVPTINDDGYVTMKIKPEVSSVDDQLTYQIAADVNNTVPLVAKTTAETTVMVKDNNTIIIGGMRKDEKVKTVDKFPILGDIPFLGMAFRKTSEKLEKTEIVVFITPHIISGDKDVVDEAPKPKDIRGYGQVTE